jgi:hypothetical protein
MDKTPERTLEDYHDMAELIAYISGHDPKGPVTKELLPLICKHSRNSFAIQDIELQSVGVALYPTISFINHSCDPNAFLCQDGPKGSIIVYKDLKEGDQIFVSYVETLETREGRREGLMEEYFFECQCDVCESKVCVFFKAECGSCELIKDNRTPWIFEKRSSALRQAAKKSSLNPQPFVPNARLQSNLSVLPICNLKSNLHPPNRLKRLKWNKWKRSSGADSQIQTSCSFNSGSL